MRLGLPFGVLSAMVTTWFVVTCLHGHLPSQDAQAIFSGKQLSVASISAPAVSAATQSVALLNTDDVDAVDSGVANHGWSEAVSLDSAERKADPAANPFLDSTPIRVAHRAGAHIHHRNKHHQKVFHHH